MHVVVLRKPVYERDRWIAMNLVKPSRSEARQPRAHRGHRRIARSRALDRGAGPPLAVLAGEDFWPYGVEANRPTLEAFLQYAFEQGVGRKRLAVEDLFARETLESFKNLVDLDADILHDLGIFVVVAADQRGEFPSQQEGSSPPA